MRKSILLLLAITVVLAAASFAYAQPATGTIRIGPDVWPVSVPSPADFEIWVEGGGDPTYDPHVLLVMTEDCWNGLTGDVVVSWDGNSTSFNKLTDFTGVWENSAYVPDANTTEGARYTVAALKDHLSYGLSEPINSTDTIYWAMGAFLDGPITGTPQNFTVDLPSTDPRMLVYALGKTEGSEVFDNFIARKVPPTNPGFIVPELGTVFAALASFTAFALYALKRRK